MSQEPGPAIHDGGKAPSTTFFGPKTLAALAFVAGVLVALLVAGAGTCISSGTAAVPPATCGEKTVQYINANQVTPGTSATLTGVREYRGVYAVDLDYSAQNITVYTTHDCNLLFADAINMSTTSARSSTQAAVNTSDRPDIELYVMSFCPYGTQAETAMKPVTDLLGADADIHVRYIATVSGSTVSSVQSLHGAKEVQEDLRQVCIAQNYPNLYWEYLEGFDSRCYPLSGNSTAMDACRGNLTASFGMDGTAITSCAAGNSSVGTLASDESSGNALGVQGSPTLIINGVTYNGARTPEAYKEAVCNSFNVPPAACSTNLSSEGGASSGGCS
ncbi:MAG: hypothetical protein WC342_03615 [Methanoregula sp.]|jgi:hypothetical protein